MATLYSSIKDDLLAKIKEGTYKEGDVIPPEVELAKSYGVSRPTIRQALQILANDGYVEKRKRRGTIVTKPKVSQGLTMGVRSFEDDMTRAGRAVRSTVIIFKRERAMRKSPPTSSLSRAMRSISSCVFAMSMTGLTCS